MPILKNDRHEQFARYLSQGMTEYEAHIKAGFSGHKPAMKTLVNRQDIRHRVAELIKEQEDNLANEECEIPEALMESEQISVTRTWLLKQLADNVLKSKRAGQYSASNKAIEMLGNYLGGIFNAKQAGMGTAAELGHPPLTGAQSFNALIEFAKGMAIAEEEPEPNTGPSLKDVTPVDEEGKPIRRQGSPAKRIIHERGPRGRPKGSKNKPKVGIDSHDPDITDIDPEEVTNYEEE